ncbi:hypothetical protein MLD38_003586 [Melastoma candidum]|uniref:Uncharacterized protein n=1 Tax=Melastoma candidum TaxID=119954 RepID=A0ACB9S2A2_9MYRT|nr:hypothetical protein MLD38_003586 [Melastoma candidum]
MPSITRKRRADFPAVAIVRDSDSEESSSEEDDDDEPEDEEEEGGGDDANDDGSGEEDNRRGNNEEEGGLQREDKVEILMGMRKGKDPITLTLKRVCKVCKKPGHEAGFKGATYIDCPMKPCFLCKMPGHTTMTCPHRVATEHGVVPAPCRSALNPLQFVFERQVTTKIHQIKPKYVIPNQVSCAVIRYHSRRVTCLEFHPRMNKILLTGDKKGHLGVWDIGKVYEKVVYPTHSCILNNIRLSPINDEMVYSVSSDGTISYTDIETGISSSLMNLNPNGWQGPSKWRMLYGMDINSERGLVLVADSFGLLYYVDARSNNEASSSVLIHKKGSKVVGLHCNPMQPDLLLSCGNDHFARIWDMRKLQADSSLCNLAHRRVVNSAYFSPLSGTKVMTTAQDNRLRIWDSIFGDMSSPSREIVHSHDFNRHLTPFRAEWDPKDPSESLAVIGRYISENYNGTALHPIDFIDTSTGQLIAEVMDPNITTISPVNKLHPRDDVLATGSSRSLFIWKPKEDPEFVEEKKEDRKIIVYGKEAKKQNKSLGDDSDDDQFSSKGKGSKFQKPEPRSESSSKRKVRR